MITVWLAPAGPPWVVAYTWSKTLKLKMSSRIETMTSCGFRSGSVTDQKLRQGPAPSMAAAS
jgi:hypothetical protein